LKKLVVPPYKLQSLSLEKVQGPFGIDSNLLRGGFIIK